MDYEKKYKEALERAKDVKNGPCPHDSSVATVEYIFPELRESEDERIRKEMVDYFSQYKDDGIRGVDITPWIAYLEKLKEQKPVEIKTGNPNTQNVIKSFVDSMSPDESLTGIEHDLALYAQLLAHYKAIKSDVQYNNALKGFAIAVKESLNEQKEQKPDTFNEPYNPDDYEVVTEGNATILKRKEQKFKMTPKWLYRLEFKDSSCGLWYDGYGKWCFESGIGSISGCKTKTLPMDYDARYKQDGRDWFSSCSRKEDLMHWYSLEDAKELISKGFVFTRYLATEYHEYEQQTVFIKETALYREEIDIFELLGQKPAEWSEEDEKNLGQVISGRYLPLGLREWFCGLPERFSSRPSWKPSEQEKGALRTAIHILTDERNFPKAAAQLQNILDAFEGKESRKDWKPSEEQIQAIKYIISSVPLNYLKEQAYIMGLVCEVISNLEKL